MGCAERERIAELGDLILVEGSAERRRVLAHARDCAECRRAATAIDPTLVVSDLPPVPVSREEIESVKSQVLAASRMRRLDRMARATGSKRRRWAAVAALTAGILLVAEESGRRIAADAPPSGGETLAASDEYMLFGALPLAGSVESPQRRIYQLDREEGFALVWIVDEAFEVPPPSSP